MQLAFQQFVSEGMYKSKFSNCFLFTFVILAVFDHLMTNTTPTHATPGQPKLYTSIYKYTFTSGCTMVSFTVTDKTWTAISDFKRLYVSFLHKLRLFPMAFFWFFFFP